MDNRIMWAALVAAVLLAGYYAYDRREVARQEMAHAEASADKLPPQGAEILYFLEARRGGFHVTHHATIGDLDLEDVGGRTVWFTDRPIRDAGHMSSVEFFRDWESGKKESFRTMPLNATLIWHQEGRVSTAVVELTQLMNWSPLLERSNGSEQPVHVSFSVKLLSGVLPDHFEKVSLFVEGNKI